MICVKERKNGSMRGDGCPFMRFQSVQELRLNFSNEDPGGSLECVPMEEVEDQEYWA